MTDKISYDYSDVNLIAQQSAVHSRGEIPNEGRKIVVSAMTSIIGPSFIEAVARIPQNIRPTLHIPRDKFAIANLELAWKLGLINHTFVGVGVNTPKIEEAARKYGFHTVLLDVANGYSPLIIDKAKKLQDEFNVITGSVHTVEGVSTLIDIADVYMIRTGIAPGSVCMTADSTGFTRGTFTEVSELSEFLDSQFGGQVKLVADGGFKCPGDLVKSFLAGADYCMSGRLFVNAYECRMHQPVESEELGEFPQGLYFGMASEYGQMAMGKERGTLGHIEGTVQCVIAKYSLEDIINTIWDGIRSGISYSGYSSLSDAIGNGVFEVKH